MARIFWYEKKEQSEFQMKGKISNPPHDLRLHALPTQLSRHGYGGFDHAHLQEMPSRAGKCGEPDNMEMFKIPTTSVNTCISINTLKKASERSLESSFRREFGLSMRSDVDELKEELAALRRRLATEEAEAKKLREEVNYLRSCGVLQRSEDSSSDERVSSQVPPADYAPIAPVKQLRKCFSGPMLFDVPSPSDSALVPYSTQTRISSHRVGLSPKPQKNQQSEVDATKLMGDEQKISKVSLSSNLQHYPSTKVAAWTSQTTEEGHHDGLSKDLVVLDSMDVHWIEVANVPCASGFSTNVSRDDDQAESPRRPPRAERLIGKRRQSKRSMDLQEPTEKRQSLALSSSHQAPASLTSEQIEEQLSQAVAAFRQQKLELEAKHQASFCQGPPNNAKPSSNNPAGVAATTGFFRNSRKKSHAMRNRSGFQRSLSPVKEALSIEEISWRNESTKPSNPTDHVSSSKSGASHQGFKFAAQILEISPTKSSKGSEPDCERPSAMENIAMVPIQCASPSPQKKSSAAALDALCALAATSKTPAEARYGGDDSMEGLDWIQSCCWEDVDEVEGINPIECASPSFSDRPRKSSRAPGTVRQSISFEEDSSLMASSNEFLDEVFRTKRSPGGKWTPSRTSQEKFCPSPQRKHWSPSPQKQLPDMVNERNWYCDAIDAIQSINDVRSSRGRPLLTESVSVGNSPSGKLTQRHVPPRNPHAFSAEKKVLRRAFSWYVTEHDERMKTFGFKNKLPERDEPEQCRTDVNTAQTPVRGKHPNASFKKGVLHARRFSDSDSSGSATFSIDLTRAENMYDRSHALNELDARDSTTSHASFSVDKENTAISIGLALSKSNNILRASEQLLTSSDNSQNQHLRRSQECIPENRSVLGSVPFNHWDNNTSPSDVYNEDSSGERHVASQRAGAKPSPRENSKILWRSRSFV